MSTSGTSIAVERYRPVSLINKLGSWLAPMILLAVDYGAIFLALLSTIFCRGILMTAFFPMLSPLVLPSNYIHYIIPVVYIGLILYERLYTKRLPFWQCAEKLFKIALFATLITATLIYFTGESKETSRLFIMFSGFFCFVYLTVARFLVKRLLVKAGLWQKPLIIIGAGKTAGLLAQAFEKEPSMGYKIVGLIDDELEERPLLRKYPHIGAFANAEKVIRESEIKDVIIAVPSLEREELLKLVYRVQPYVRNLTIVPDLFGLPLSNMTVNTLFSEKTVLLNVHNNLARRRNRLLKKMFDLLIGVPILLIILPVLMVLGILVKVDSPGPVFHIARRMGKNGKEFLCYKFRTMYVNGDGILKMYLGKNAKAKIEWEKFAKLKDDPRVTPVGKWMRKFSLDELPQIVNVLTGEMSLVGPRPYLPREKEKMGYFHYTILQTVPGITGLWQVSGRNEIDFEGRLRLDEWYVHNWSLWQDIVLLFKTVEVVLKRKGAY